MTSGTFPLRKTTESSIIARFSSRLTRRASLTWSSQLLPKMVTTGVFAATRARRLSSSEAFFRARRVDPKAASLAFFRVRPAASTKKAASFGLAPGQPPSM
jgi:hypothetical protein